MRRVAESFRCRGLGSYLVQELKREAYELGAIPAELEKLDWSRLIQTTPDFVVYAVDFELRDLRKNLKKILDPAKLAALNAAKLI